MYFSSWPGRIGELFHALEAAGVDVRRKR